MQRISDDAGARAIDGAGTWWWKLVASVLLMLFVVVRPATAQVVFNFEDAADPLRSVGGSARLGYFDPARTGWGPVAGRIQRASAFGLPAAPDGGDPVAMRLPGLAGQGLVVRHLLGGSGAFGSTGRLGDATVVIDALWPSASDGRWRALLQTGESNADDAELFVQNVTSGGIGVLGQYDGAIRPGVWHRVVFVIAASPTGGSLRKFIDGRLVGVQNGIDGRWAMGSLPLLFADNDGETAEVYVASVAVDRRAWTDNEVASLGRMNSAGAMTAGPRVDPPDATRRIVVIGHRGNSGQAPENTLVSMRQAFDLGADMVEFDTMLTSDGVAIGMHDSTLDRTTNGTGATASRPWSYIQTLDAGSWFSARYTGERVPSLVDGMRSAMGRGVLYLDIKVFGMGPSIAAAMAETGMSDEGLWLWVGESMAQLDQLRVHLPGGRFVWGDFNPNDRAFMRSLKAKGVVAFDVPFGSATAAKASAAEAEGMVFSVYTVNGEATMRQMIELGVDAMETDFPGTLNGIMRGRFGADATGDGLVNIFDVLAFFDGFAASDHRADVAEPRLSWDIFDVLRWLTLFGGG